MRKTARGAAVMGVAGAVALATSGVASAATGTTFSVQAIQTGSHIIKDTPPTGMPNPGDKVLFTEKLLQNNRKVGTDRVVQTFLQSNAMLIDGVWTFTSGAKGTLHVHGPLVFGSSSIVLPVVGGTGAFAGKKGTLTVIPSGGATTETFNLK